jgi:hypothetical protein
MLHAPAVCCRIQPSTSASSINASWPKPPGTCRTSSGGASASVASGEAQSLHIANGLGGFAVDSIGGVRDARQNLERAGEVDLVHALE